MPLPVVVVCLSLAAAFLGVISGYLLFLTAGSFLLRKKANMSAAPLRIAILSPAHNEELQIETTIARFLASDYPRDRFDVFVIADNCSDSTAKRARTAGATVFARTDKVLRGKGQALDWCLKTHRDAFEGYDAIALVDADGMVDSRFLSEISASLSHPDVKVVQGWYGVSNFDAGWRTALTWAGFALINGLRPAGRCHWGGTADIKGSGMAFRSGVLLAYGWPAYSIVEDIEFSLRLLLDGTLVHFNPDAAVISEMPTTKSQAEPQRRRWESGRLQTLRTYAPSLIRAFSRSPRWCFLDMLLELCVPPLSLLVLFEITCLVAAIFVSWTFAALFAAYIAATLAYVFAGLYQRRAPREVWLGLLAVPLFLVWKIPFYFRLFTGKKQEAWVRTKRVAEVQGERKRK